MVHVPVHVIYFYYIVINVHVCTLPLRDVPDKLSCCKHLVWVMAIDKYFAAVGPSPLLAKFWIRWQHI